MNRFVEFGIVILIAIALGVAVMGLVGWEYVHDKFRKERKEDAKEARKASSKTR